MIGYTYVIVALDRRIATIVIVFKMTSLIARVNIALHKP